MNNIIVLIELKSEARVSRYQVRIELDDLHPPASVQGQNTRNRNIFSPRKVYDIKARHAKTADSVELMGSAL
jgi:hypothetical protein